MRLIFAYARMIDKSLGLVLSIRCLRLYSQGLPKMSFVSRRFSESGSLNASKQLVLEFGQVDDRLSQLSLRRLLGTPSSRSPRSGGIACWHQLEKNDNHLLNQQLRLEVNVCASLPVLATELPHHGFITSQRASWGTERPILAGLSMQSMMNYHWKYCLKRTW